MAANNFLVLDIGEKRIGVARGNRIALIAEPLATISNDENFVDKLKDLLKEQQTDILVIGLPRNLSGQETAQSQYVREFTNKYLTPLGWPIVLQDETLSTKAAEERLKTYKNINFGADAMAAAIILEDYFKMVQS